MADWIFAAGLRVILIGAIATALVRIVAILVKRFEHELNLGTTLDALERAKRARTLGAVISKGATTIIVGIAGLMILRELHVDIAPVLTGAGIVGLAVGFGAQSLVKDIIGGFFLILEDQVRVGDAVMVNGVAGLVEELNLRTIVLRDGEGAVHVVPNGSITALTNRSKDYSYYVIWRIRIASWICCGKSAPSSRRIRRTGPSSSSRSRSWASTRSVTGG
jgi:small conductance mechanosensitive channel